MEFRPLPEPPSTPVRPRRRWSFSLRALMIVVLIAGVPLARVINRANRQRQAVAAILASKGFVSYDYQEDDRLKGPLAVRDVPPGPAWLRSWLGNEYFQEVVGVSLSRPVTVTDLAAIGHFDRLKVLTLTYIGKSDDDLTPLGGLGRLESLTLHGYGLNDRSIAPIGRLTSLRTLEIQTTSLSDAGLAPLGSLTQLQSLGLSFSERIGSSGWIALAGRLPQLLEVNLGWTAVDDSAIDSFVRMPHLTNLDLTGSEVTKEGVARLQEARPHMEVTQNHVTMRTGTRPSHPSLEPGSAPN